MHNSKITDEETQKPIQILDYNATKGGVDSVDQMCSRITTSRRTKRWPMVIFFRLLDLAGINSLRIYQFNNPHITNNTRRPFLYELSRELMEENLKERSKIGTLPKDLTLFLEQYKDPVAPIAVPTTRRGICYLCGSKKKTIEPG